MGIKGYLFLIFCICFLLIVYWMQRRERKEEVKKAAERIENKLRQSRFVNEYRSEAFAYITCFYMYEEIEVAIVNGKRQVVLSYKLPAELDAEVVSKAISDITGLPCQITDGTIEISLLNFKEEMEKIDALIDASALNNTVRCETDYVPKEKIQHLMDLVVPIHLQDKVLELFYQRGKLKESNELCYYYSIIVEQLINEMLPDHILQRQEDELVRLAESISSKIITWSYHKLEDGKKCFFAASKNYTQLEEKLTDKSFWNNTTYYYRRLENVKKSLLGISNTKAGFEGEMLVNEYIEKFKPEFDYISGITLKYGKQTAEIDSIIFSKRGIFIIEVKNWGINGGMTLNIAKDGRWTKEYANSTEMESDNPVEQNAYHVHFIEKIINPEFSKDIPLYNVVVIANNEVKISGDDTEGIVRVSKLYDYIRSKDIVLTDEQVLAYKTQILQHEVDTVKYEFENLYENHCMAYQCYKLFWDSWEYMYEGLHQLVREYEGILWTREPFAQCLCKHNIDDALHHLAEKYNRPWKPDEIENVIFSDLLNIYLAKKYPQVESYTIEVPSILKSGIIKLYLTHKSSGNVYVAYVNFEDVYMLGDLKLLEPIKKETQLNEWLTMGKNS